MNPTPIAMHPNIMRTDNASSDTPKSMGHVTEMMQKKIPTARSSAFFLLFSMKPFASSIPMFLRGTSLSLVRVSSTTFSSPKLSAISSRFPNSDITVPTAVFSLCPPAISSLYLSSIIWSSSAFAFLTSAVLGIAANIASR